MVVYEVLDSETVRVSVEYNIHSIRLKTLLKWLHRRDFYSSIKDEAYTYPQTTKENFNKLEGNMSYESVSALLGGPGKLVSETYWADLNVIFGTAVQKIT